MAQPLALYIHWPFCKSKCPYCDFNSHVRDSIDQTRWQKTLLAELDHWAPALKGRELVSIFFGGGTPSLMAPATAAALIERAARHWHASPDLEITLEANPTSVEASRFAELRAAGVNRVSLGVQALDDASLKFLGRGHNAGEAREAVKLAARLFDRFSFDLIYARPGMTVEAWRDELSAALAMAGDHLSLYQLTIEPGTAFATAFARGDFQLPDEETQGALYETTHDMLATAGLPAYEISNHARPGQECRHNLVYWRYQDYLGIGPGAHGRLTLEGEKRALKNFRAPEKWLKTVEGAGNGVEESLLLAAGERRDEMLMMGLRLGEGVTRDAFRAETGAAFEQSLDAAQLAKLSAAGFLALDETSLRATDAGRQRLNAVLGALLA
jgi:putative oxygen-independent coproporphyrinogen III oxidase